MSGGRRRSGRQARVAAFVQGLRQLGWSDGRNVRIDISLVPEASRSHSALARELVALAPDVILAQSTPVVAALQQATRTVPIVFVGVADPVGAGFVESLARPGGNVTGLHAVRIRHQRRNGWSCSRRSRRSVTRVGGLRQSCNRTGLGQFGAHPGRGAVARGGGGRSRHARRRRDRARRHGVRALPNGGLIVLPDATYRVIAI